MALFSRHDWPAPPLPPLIAAALTTYIPDQFRRSRFHPDTRRCAFFSFSRRSMAVAPGARLAGRYRFFHQNQIAPGNHACYQCPCDRPVHKNKHRRILQSPWKNRPCRALPFSSHGISVRYHHPATDNAPGSTAILSRQIAVAQSRPAQQMA